MRQSSYHKRERKKEEGSKSTRPTEARQGQQVRENRNSPNQDQDHHVETNKQTTIKLATYILRFIIHGYACIRCHRVFVRSCDRWLVRACVSHHITREKEEEGSKSTRPTEARQGQQLRENRNRKSCTSRQTNTNFRPFYCRPPTFWRLPCGASEGRKYRRMCNKSNLLAVRRCERIDTCMDFE